MPPAIIRILIHCVQHHPLGIVLLCGKIGILRAVRTCHSEPIRRLVWESPSNFGQPIVIQTVLFVPLSGIFPREVVLLTRRLPRQFENWLAMTGKSAARQISICQCTFERTKSLNCKYSLADSQKIATGKIPAGWNSRSNLRVFFPIIRRREDPEQP